MKLRRKWWRPFCWSCTRRQETILIVVTHNPALAARFAKRYELRHANLHPAGA